MPEWCPSTMVAGRKHRIGTIILCTYCTQYNENQVIEVHGSTVDKISDHVSPFDPRYDGSRGPFCMVGSNILHKTGTKRITCKLCRAWLDGAADVRKAQLDAGQSTPAKGRYIHILWGSGDRDTQGVFNTDGSRVAGVTDVTVSLRAGDRVPSATVRTIQPVVDVLVPEDHVTWVREQGTEQAILAHGRWGKSVAAELRRLADSFSDIEATDESGISQVIDRLINRATELENEK